MLRRRTLEPAREGEELETDENEQLSPALRCRGWSGRRWWRSRPGSLRGGWGFLKGILEARGAVYSAQDGCCCVAEPSPTARPGGSGGAGDLTPGGRLCGLRARHVAVYIACIRVPDAPDNDR